MKYNIDPLAFEGVIGTWARLPKSCVCSKEPAHVFILFGRCKLLCHRVVDTAVLVLR